MERIRFTECRGKRILVLDFSQAPQDDFMRLMEEARKVIGAEPENSLLILTDVTGAELNMDIAGALKDFTVHNKPFVKASAVVGVTGARKIMHDSVMLFSKRKIPRFPDRESAMDWLVLMGND